MMRELASFASQLLLHLLYQLWDLVLLPLVWKFTGTSSHLQRICNGDEKELRVQVLDVWMHFPFTALIQSGLHILSHKQFISLDQVRWDKAVLYRVSVAKQVAEFTLFQESVDPFDVSKHSLLLEVQKDKAISLLRMPLKDFSEMRHEFKPSCKQVVWLLHSIRCGSTAWSQAFSVLPEWRVLSESSPFLTSLTEDINDITSYCKTKAFKDIFEASYKHYLCLLSSSRVLVKGTLFEYLLDAIVERFPDHIILFAYRNALPSGISNYKAFNMSTREYAKIMIDRKILGSNNFVMLMIKRFCMNYYGLPEFTLTHGVTPHDLFENYMSYWCAVNACMQDACRNGYSIIGLKYERLQSNNSAYLETVFDFLGIDRALIDLSMKALERDSQAGSPYSREFNLTRKSWTRTQAGVKRVNAMLTYYGLPSIDSDYIFDNTL